MEYKDYGKSYYDCGKPYYDYCQYDYGKYDYYKNYCKKCDFDPVLLECGVRPQDAIFTITGGGVAPDQEYVLDRVKIDTTCFAKPLVKIEFSSIVFLEAVSAETVAPFTINAQLRFSLIRVCSGEREVVQTWDYQYFTSNSAAGGISAILSQPFTVTYCDKPCSGCCEYIMQVEGLAFSGVFFGLRVVKPDLSAIVSNYC